MSEILQGNCLDVLKTLDSESVNCCITSPPYWGLRDYGTDDQLGLEETPEEYVDNMVKVFSEVKRVLKPDGTLWLNLGDSYARQGGDQSNQTRHWDGREKDPGMTNITHCKNLSMKPKDLVGIPWMVAFALRSDGWWLRQDIIWHKPNPMPESVTDRCTKAHEYIFLMSKSAKYYCDMEAIKEDANYAGCDRGGSVNRYEQNSAGMDNKKYDTRNKRSVWTVTTKPYKEAHFATYPEKLIEPCVLAGCPEGGIIIDPFFGAGTTGVVAERWGREYIGIELNPEYINIARKRVQEEKDKMGLFNGMEQ